MATDEKIDDLLEHLSLINTSTDNLHDSIQILLENIHTENETNVDSSDESIADQFRDAISRWTGSREYDSSPVQFNLIDSITQGIKRYHETASKNEKEAPRKVVDDKSDMSILADRLDDIKTLLDPDLAKQKIEKRDIKDEKGFFSNLFGPGSALLLTGLASLVGAFMDFGGPFTGFLEAWGKWSTMGGMQLLKSAWGGSAKLFEIFIRPFKSLFSVGAKTAMKTGTKTGLRAIPFIGALFSFGFAIKSAQEGDYFGMSLDIVSGILNLIPTGITQVLSAGLDIFHGFLEYQNETQADPITGKKPGKGNVLLGMLRDASKAIGEDIMRGIHFLPVIGPILLAGEAVEHFNEGRHRMGLDTAVRAVSGLVPWVGPTLYEGLNFISSLMDGSDAIKNPSFLPKFKATPEPEEWKKNPSLREDYYRTDSQSTSPTFTPPVFIPPQAVTMENLLTPTITSPQSTDNTPSAEEQPLRFAQFGRSADNYLSKQLKKDQPLTQGERWWLRGNNDLKDEYNEWKHRQVSSSLPPLESTTKATEAQTFQLSNKVDELIKIQNEQSGQAKRNTDDVVNAITGLHESLDSTGDSTFITNNTGSGASSVSEITGYRDFIRKKLGEN